MFIELVDRLRCPEAHRDSWLVARMDRVEDRDIVEGALGCPVCHAEFLIHDGAVAFGSAPASAPEGPDSDAAMHLAAGLGLVAANQVALLQGGWGAHARLLRALSPAQLLLLNPPEAVESGDGVSVLRGPAVRLANASMDAAALDESLPAEALERLLQSIRSAGRVIGRGAFPEHPGLELILSGQEIWVAEVSRPGPVVPLRRA